MKKRIYAELLKRWNECLSLGLYISFMTVLRTAYDTASERNQYERAAIIQDLIIDDINS